MFQEKQPPGMHVRRSSAEAGGQFLDSSSALAQLGLGVKSSYLNLLSPLSGLSAFHAFPAEESLFLTEIIVKYLLELHYMERKH